MQLMLGTLWRFFHKAFKKPPIKHGVLPKIPSWRALCLLLPQKMISGIVGLQYAKCNGRMLGNIGLPSLNSPPHKICRMHLWATTIMACQGQLIMQYMSISILMVILLLVHIPEPTHL
mmetsp:Transcript_63945/g.114150  ORF Transcript_63945/g.114150 Transcript_63945/m.114150 type:complete len:118 (-) Transcript_63945:302-655(-)